MPSVPLRRMGVKTDKPKVESANENGLLIQEVGSPEVEFKRLAFRYHEIWDEASLDDKRWT